MLLRHYTQLPEEPVRWERTWITLEEFLEQLKQERGAQPKENEDDEQDA